MNSPITAQQAQNLLRPLLGQLAWHVRGGYGSFLTLEFGQPHIEIREPINPSPDHSARVQRNLLRRRAFIVGDWHLWIQYCDWTISVPGGSLTSKDIGSSSPEE